MKTAIEILERALKSLMVARNLWDGVSEENSSKRLADFDKKIAEVKAAIDRLQRKVKKDPRVDGLPECTVELKSAGMTFHISPHLLIWHKMNPKFTIIGYFNKELGWKTPFDTGYESTDEILFYADPNEII